MDSIQQTGRIVAFGVAAAILTLQFLRLLDLAGMIELELTDPVFAGSVAGVALAAATSFFFYDGSRVAYWLTVALFGPGLLAKLALVNVIGVGATLGVFDQSQAVLVAEGLIGIGVTATLMLSRSLAEYLRFQRRVIVLA